MNNYHVLTMGGGLRLLEPSGLHKWGAAYEGRDARRRGGGRRRTLHPVFFHLSRRAHTPQVLPHAIGRWDDKHAGDRTRGVSLDSGHGMRSGYGNSHVRLKRSKCRDYRGELHDKCHCVLVMPEAAL